MNVETRRASTISRRSRSTIGWARSSRRQGYVSDPPGRDRVQSPLPLPRRPRAELARRRARRSLPLLRLRCARRRHRLRDAPRRDRLRRGLSATRRHLDGTLPRRPSEQHGSRPTRTTLGPPDPGGAGRAEYGRGDLPALSLARAPRPRVRARARPSGLGHPLLRSRLRRRPLPRGLPAPSLRSADRPGARPPRRPDPARDGEPLREFLAGRIVIPGDSGGPVRLVHRPAARRRGRRRPKYLALPGERPGPRLRARGGSARSLSLRGVFDYLTAIAWRLPAFSPCGTAIPAERLGFLARARVVYGVLDGGPGRSGRDRALRADVRLSLAPSGSPGRVRSERSRPASRWTRAVLPLARRGPLNCG